MGTCGSTRAGALPTDAALLPAIGQCGGRRLERFPARGRRGRHGPSTAGGHRQAGVPDSAGPRLHPGQREGGRGQTSAREAARDRTRSGDLVAGGDPGPGEQQRRGAAALAGAGQCPGLEGSDESGGEARGPLHACLHLHQWRGSLSHESVGGCPPPRSHLADQAQGQCPPGLLSKLSPREPASISEFARRWVRFWKSRRGRCRSFSPTR